MLRLVRGDAILTKSKILLDLYFFYFPIFVNKASFQSVKYQDKTKILPDFGYK